MNQNKPCEVEGCTGTYQEKTVDYCNLMKVGTDEYRISVDDLDVRLIEFCKQLRPCNSAG